MKQASLTFEQMQTILEQVTIDMAKQVKIQKESEEKRKEFEEKRKEAEEERVQREKERAIKLAEFDARLDKFGRLYGGLGNNIGEQAEEFFYQGFKNNPSIQGMSFDEVDRNVSFHGKEYDIVLYNGNSLALFSIKHKLHPKDIEHFVSNDIPQFIELFPQYKGYTIYGGVGALTMKPAVYKQAQDAGLFVFTQSGDKPLIKNTKNFIAKKF